MYGTHNILQSNVVSVDTYKTIGSSIQSFFFRIIVNVIKLQNLQYQQSNYSSLQSHEHWYLAINNALSQQQVDLSFLNEITTESSQNSIKLMIQSLPPNLSKLFIQGLQCQCGYQEQIIVFSQVQRHCQHCQNLLQTIQVPIISFSSHKNSLQHQIFNENYYLNGFMTQNQNNEYSILVDFQKLLQNAIDIFILESMPKTDLQVTLQKKISQLVYLKTNKVIPYIQSFQQKMQDKLGTIQINCWINEKYFSKDQQRAFLSMIGQKPQPLQIAQSQNLTDSQSSFDDPQQKIEEVQEQRISYPKVFDHSWIIYFILIIILLLLIVAMIILSVLIGRLNTTLTVNNVITKGTSFIALPQVQSSIQAQSFINTFNPAPLNSNNIHQINQLQSFNTPYSLFLGIASFTSLKFNQLQFQSVNFPPNPLLQPTQSIPIVVTNLNSGTITTNSLTTRTGLLQNQVQFTSAQTMPNILIQLGTVGNIQSQNFESTTVNAQNFAPITLQAGTTSLTDFQCPSNTINNANLGALTINQLTTTNFVTATAFTINQPVSLQNLIFDNSNMIFQDSVTKVFPNVVNFDYSNLQMNGNLITVTTPVSAINIISRTSFTSTGVTQFGTIQVNTGMSITGTINLDSLTVNQNGTVNGQFITNNINTINSTSQSLSISQTIINNVLATSPLPLNIGAAMFANNKITYPSSLGVQSTSLEFIGQQLTQQDIIGTTVQGVLNSLNLQSMTMTSLICNYNNAQANTFTAQTSITSTNIQSSNYLFNIGGVSTPLMQQAGNSIIFELAILNGNTYCSTRGDIIQ